MNVKELIEKLSQYDPETLVVVSGYEGGVTQKMVVFEKEISLNVYDESEWWYGEHEISDAAKYRETDENVFNKSKAIIISR